MFNITNYSEHPTKKIYTVFWFKTLEQAHFFENLLATNRIFFEKYTEEDNSVIYFAIKNIDYKISVKLNYETIGRFRSQLIPNKILRYTIISISAICIAIAIAGYIKNQF